MTPAELEDEIREALIQVLSTSDQPERVQAQEVQLATYYLVEVAKRWNADRMNITRVRVRQLAIKHMKRRLREEGADQLKQLVATTADIAAPDDIQNEVTYVQEDKRDRSSASDETGTGRPQAGGRGSSANEGLAFLQQDAEGDEDATQSERPVGDVARPRADIAPPPEVGESFSSTRGAGAGHVYTVCKSCGRIQGRLDADAKKKWVDRCGECS